MSIRIFPPMATRPCRFCLSLQDDSVFADFNVDNDGNVVLIRISFDGFGCCRGFFKKMSAVDSRVLLESVQRGAVEDPKVERILRNYFEENSDIIWREALTDHDLLCTKQSPNSC